MLHCLVEVDRPPGGPPSPRCAPPWSGWSSACSNSPPPRPPRPPRLPRSAPAPSRQARPGGTGHPRAAPRPARPAVGQPAFAAVLFVGQVLFDLLTLVGRTCVDLAGDLQAVLDYLRGLVAASPALPARRPRPARTPPRPRPGSTTARVIRPLVGNSTRLGACWARSRRCAPGCLSEAPVNC
ncbi:hypothetical protein GZL_00172 [Streptomyces sp. 769]|nr:hypothetical protein GZL_00172 [Streptomyces sp. 769]